MTLSTDEKIDKLLEVLSTAQHSTPVQEKRGEWFVLKIVGSISLGIVTMAISAGLFWVIQTVSNNEDAIAANKQAMDTKILLDKQNNQVVNEKLDEMIADIKTVEGNTQNRFTPGDFTNGTRPLLDDISQNKSDIQLIKQMLNERNSFMSDTTSDIKALERQVYGEAK